LLDRVDVLRDLGREYRTIDQVGFDLLALETVEPDVAGRVDQLTEVDAVVLVGDKADDVSRFGRHGG
jgi:hypothetical protein